MVTFSVLLAFCAENSPVTGQFPAQWPVKQSFDVFFDLRLNQQLSIQWLADDLRCHRAHYDVIVTLVLQLMSMILILFGSSNGLVVYVGVVHFIHCKKTIHYEKYGFTTVNCINAIISGKFMIADCLEWIQLNLSSQRPQ